LEQVIFGGWGYGAPIPTTDTRYNTLHSGYTWATDEFRRWQVISTDGVIKNFRLTLVDAPPGNGKKYTFTLYLNGNPTALTFDIADLAVSGSDMVNEVAVTGGDTVTFECVPDGTPTSSNALWTSMFVSDNPNESLILGVASSQLHRTDTEYGQVMTAGTNLSAAVGAENDRRQVIPTSGKIKNFYVAMDIDPGTAPDAYRFTVRLNGATVADSPIVTITANDKTGSDLVHELDVVAGDYITMMVEPVNTPATWPYAGWGMTFEADIDGESIVIGGSSNGLDRWTSGRYIALSRSEGSSWDTNENRRWQLGQICTLKKLHILISAPPGAGNHWDFTTRIGGADSNVVLEIADAATTGDSGALEDTVALDDTVSLKVVATDVPDAADGYWGIVCYIEPPVPSGSEDLLGKFDVGQGSDDLLGKAKIQQSGSAELFGKFEAQATAELLGKAVIRNIDSAELLGRTLIRQSGSAELLCKSEVQQSGSEELIGKAVIRHVGTPVELLGKVEVQQSGSAELLGNGIIRHPDIAELLVKVEVRGLDFAELLGRAVIRHVGIPTELLGEFIVRHETSVDLLGEFIVSHEASVDLYAAFESQTSVDLLGEFIVKHSATINLPAKIIVRHLTTLDLLCKFIVRHLATINLPAEFIVRHETSVDLLGEFIVRHSTTLDLLGEFIVRHSITLDLLGEFIVSHEASVDLYAAFESQTSVDLLGEFVVRNVGTADLPTVLIVRNASTANLSAKFQVTHSECLFSKLWIRHPYRFWTNRRYINGIVELDEAELSDALLLTSGGRRLMIVDTEDEEAVFSLEDIPFYTEDPYKIKVR